MRSIQSGSMRSLAIVFLSVFEIASAAHGQAVENDTVYGGYNAVFLPSGIGLKKALKKVLPPDAPVSAGATWSMYCWVRSDDLLTAPYDGITASLYVDGLPPAQQIMTFTAVTPVLEMAPEKSPWPDAAHYAGKIAGFSMPGDSLVGSSRR